MQHQPLGLAPVAAEAVLLVFDVEVERIARDFKIEGRRLQVAEEVINLHPLTRRALLQSFSQHCTPRCDGSDVAPAAVAFAFDDLNAAELIEQFRLLPVLPDEAQRCCRRHRKRGAPGLGQRQFLAAQLGELGGLQQHRPCEGFDRADLLVGLVAF